MGKIFAFISMFFVTASAFFQPEVEVIPEKKDDGVTMLFVGDTMLGRQVGSHIKQGIDPFLYVRETMMNYDLVVANLEGPISEPMLCQKKAYSFRFATTTAKMLSDNNIGLVNLANNHSFDCYTKGLINTRQNLTKANVEYFGGGELADSYIIKEIKGKKIAFVGIDLSIGEIPIKSFYPLISRLDKENDSVVVSIHWGNEYELNYSNNQKVIGHNLVDKGADLIIGHHPHVIQPLEIYNNKPIFYSLGNFVFDQFEEETVKGFAAEIFWDGEVTDLKILPYRIKTSQPSFLEEEEKEKFCRKFLQNFPSENKNEEICSVEINP